MTFIRRAKQERARPASTAAGALHPGSRPSVLRSRLNAMIFDERERDDHSPGQHGESTFSFFNRCGDPAINAVRELLEDWVSRYPSAGPDPSARAELISRFRSKDNTEFQSAFWELHLHESLTRAGYELAPHPETTSGRRPDFLATKGADRLYVEAALVTSIGLTGQAETPGIEDVYAKLDSGFHPDFWVKVVRVIPGSSTPRRSAIVTPVERWLGTLDWQSEWSRYGRAELPETTIESRGWRLTLRAHPKSPESRGDRSSRMIGIYPTSGGISIADVGISQKLHEKAYRYGQLKAPYLIAILSLAMTAGADDFQFALFGHWPQDSHEDPGALWHRGNEPRGTRVSAVVGAFGFTFGGAHSVAKTWPQLWQNPWAAHPIQDSDLPWPMTVVDAEEGSFESVPSTFETPAVFFGLERDWPGEPFADD